MRLTPKRCLPFLLVVSVLSPAPSEQRSRPRNDDAMISAERSVDRLAERIDLSPKAPRRPSAWSWVLYRDAPGDSVFIPAVRRLVQEFAPTLHLASELEPTLVDSFVTVIFERQYRDTFPDSVPRDRFREVGSHVYLLRRPDDRKVVRAMATGWREPAVYRPDTIAVRYFNPLWDVELGDRFREYRDQFSRLPGFYCHPFASSDGKVVLQYWFFYYYNHWINKHEGDWEHINVVLHPLGWQPASADELRAGLEANRPFKKERVEYYFHHQFHVDADPEPEGGPAVFVGGRSADSFLGVFSSRDSHGNFPRAGFFPDVELLAHEYLGPVHKRDPHAFHIELLPDLERIDWGRDSHFDRWFWLGIDVLWGYPASIPEVPGLLATVDNLLWNPIAKTLSSASLLTDVGTRSPVGPAYKDAWNTTGVTPNFRPYANLGRRNWAWRIAQTFECFVHTASLPEFNRDPQHLPGGGRRDLADQAHLDLDIHLSLHRPIRLPGTGVLFTPEITALQRHTQRRLNPFIYHAPLELSQFPGLEGEFPIPGSRQTTIVFDSAYPNGVDVMKANIVHSEYRGFLAGARLNLLRRKAVRIGLRLRTGVAEEESHYNILRIDESLPGQSFRPYRAVTAPRETRWLSEVMGSVQMPVSVIAASVEFGWEFYGSSYFFGSYYHPFRVRVGVGLPGKG